MTSIGSAGGPGPLGGQPGDAPDAADAVTTTSPPPLSAASPGTPQGRDQVMAGLHARSASALADADMSATDVVAKVQSLNLVPAGDKDYVYALLDNTPLANLEAPLPASATGPYAKLKDLVFDGKDHSPEIYGLLQDTSMGDLDAIYDKLLPDWIMRSMKGSDERAKCMLDLTASLDQGRNVQHLADYVRTCDAPDFLEFVSRADDDALRDFAATPDGRAVLTTAAENLWTGFWEPEREPSPPAGTGAVEDVSKNSPYYDRAQAASARLTQILGLPARPDRQDFLEGKVGGYHG
jgi:hypothetical protein